MVTKSRLIAWSKATLHAIVVPTILCLLPFSWAFALLWLAGITWLYATALKDRSAALPFAALAFLNAVFIISLEVINGVM